MNLTAAEAFSLVRDGVMLFIAALVYYWGQDRQKTDENYQNKFREFTKRVDDLELRIKERFEDAGEKTSNLATKVQGLLGCTERIKRLEDVQVDEHKLRRDLNQDLGKLDIRLTKVEVRQDEVVRRLDNYERN